MVRKNRLVTDLLREIKNTRSRFLSLLVLSALAVCFLAGLRATEPDMKRSADQYFDQQKLMDLHIVSTLGVTEEDVAALADQPGVREAEGACTVDAVVPIDGSGYIVKALSFTQTPGINAPRLVEGRFPQRGDECLVEPKMLQQTGLSVGDKIVLDPGDGDFADAMAFSEYTIVGTADSPLYIYIERGSSSLGTGKVSAFVLLPLLFSFASDTGAFFAGRSLGKHKLAPRVSPHKTVEGALGGLAANALSGALFALVMNGALDYSIPYLAIALVGLACSVVAQLGDLSFSLIKREFGIKDYGRIFLEHGGVLDRFDSVLFVAPALEVLIHLAGLVQSHG